MAGQFKQLGLQQGEALALALAGAARGGHCHALAAQAFQQALRLGQAVGARHRHRVDRVEAGHFAHRRQQLARGELAAGDQPAQLFHDLPVDRLGRVRLYREQGGIHVYQYNNTHAGLSSMTCDLVAAVRPDLALTTEAALY